MGVRRATLGLVSVVAVSLWASGPLAAASAQEVTGDASSPPAPPAAPTVQTCRATERTAVAGCRGEATRVTRECDAAMREATGPESGCAEELASCRATHQTMVGAGYDMSFITGGCDEGHSQCVAPARETQATCRREATQARDVCAFDASTDGLLCASEVRVRAAGGDDVAVCRAACGVTHDRARTGCAAEVRRAREGCRAESASASASCTQDRRECDRSQVLSEGTGGLWGPHKDCGALERECRAGVRETQVACDQAGGGECTAEVDSTQAACLEACGVSDPAEAPSRGTVRE